MKVTGIVTKVNPQETKTSKKPGGKQYTLQNVYIKSGEKRAGISLFGQPEVPASLVGKEITFEKAEQGEVWQGMAQFTVMSQGAWLSDAQPEPVDDWGGDSEQVDSWDGAPDEQTEVVTDDQKIIKIRSALKSDYQFAMETVVAELSKEYVTKSVVLTNYPMDVSAMVNTLVIAMGQRR